MKKAIENRIKSVAMLIEFKFHYLIYLYLILISDITYKIYL